MAEVKVARPRTSAPAEPSPGSRFLDPAAIFSPTSFWGTSLPPDAALHPSSATWVRNLAVQLGLNPDVLSPSGTSLQAASPLAPGKAWFNISSGAVPVYVVSADQPRVPVANSFVLNGTAWPDMTDLHRVFMAGVPIPVGALTDPSSDHTLVIYQPSTGTYWELYYAGNNPGTDPDGNPYQWTALGGGKMLQVWSRGGVFLEKYDDSGLRIEAAKWGHTATGLPIIGGIITPEEWASGDVDAIKHPLHLVVGNGSTQFLSPANRCDGTNDDSWIREGARVRFPASWDFGYLNLGDPFSLNVAKLGRAIQNYGAIITDKTNFGCALRFRSPRSYVWEGAVCSYSYAGKQPNNFLWALPWQNAQVVTESVSPRA